MPQPLEKSSLLIGEINAMIPHARNDVRIEAIEREVALIEKAGFYYQAKQLQGMLAGLRGDTVGVRQKFKAALAASGNKFVVRKNYAQALANTHCFRDAIVEIDEAVLQAPDDLEVLLMALDMHERARDVEGCEKLIEQITRLGSADMIPASTLDKIDGLKEFLSGNGATWQDISDRIERAAQVVYSMGLSIPSFEETPTDFGVMLEFNVIGSVETALLAENAIHLEIAAQPFLPADKLIAFACLPA